MAMPASSEGPLDLAGLDPCCVREIIEKKKAATIKGKLKRYDKTNERIKKKNSVFKNMTILHTCPTCVESRDYVVLHRVREQLQQEQEQTQRQTGSDDGRKNEKEDSYLDDGLSDEDDDFLSAHEVALRQTAKEQHEYRDKYGFGRHISESTAHLLSSIRLGFAIVCHLCDETEVISGLVDVCLEGLAGRYPGTKFRRISSNRGDIHSLLQLYNVSSEGVLAGSDHGARTSRGRLICFSNGVVVNDANTEISACLGFAGGGRGSSTMCDWNDVSLATVSQYTSQLLNYLDHCQGVLMTTVPTLREINHRVSTFQDSSSGGGGNRNNGRAIDNRVLRQIADLDEQVRADNDALAEGTDEDEDEDEDSGKSDYNDSDNDEEEGDISSGNGYCNLPNCTRMFPHSHVGQGGNDTVFGMVQRQGAEALAKDFYSKV